MTYSNNQVDGISATYKFGKPVTEIPYTMGQIDGTYKEYQNNKLHKEIQYSKGKKNGTMKYFDEEGNVTVEYVYKNDEKVSGGMVKE